MQIVALYHIKGGVGKTSATVNLSYLSAESGAKTLVCDLDPQGASTFCFRVKPKFKSGIKGFIKGGRYLEKNIKGTDYENLDLLPADLAFRNLDIEIDQRKNADNRLSKILGSFETEYDYIFLDCPPNIALLSENIFNVADTILIPIIPTPLSKNSYLQLRRFFRKNGYNLKKLRAFFSMVEFRKRVHQDMMAEMRGEFKEILDAQIPSLADIEKMGIRRAPVCNSVPQSRAAKAYRKLWEALVSIHR